jgi:tetratricopeptide (TPR) repeat protein
MLPTNSGLNFWLGNNPDCRTTIGLRPQSLAWRQATAVDAEAVGADPAADPGFGRHFLRRSLAFWRSEPRQALACLGFKARTLVNGYELPETFDLYWLRRSSPVLRLLTGRLGPLWLPFAALWPLALLGAVLAAARIRPAGWLLLGAVSFLPVLLGYYNGSRYRLSLVPVLIVLAAGAADWLIAVVAGRRFRALGVAAPVLAVGLAAAAWPCPHPSRGFDFEAEAMAGVGLYRAGEGRFDDAVGWLERAAARQPGSADLAHDLGRVRLLAGDLDGARRDLLRALELKPGDGAILALLGEVELKAGNDRGAVERWRQALDHEPGLASVYFDLGNLAVQRGRPEESIPLYRKALAIDPRHAASHRNLGFVFQSLGDLERALAEYAQAVLLDPNNPKSYNNLGVVEARLGRLEQAVGHFDRALRLEPTYDEARRNLEQARRLLESRRP